jgi:GNAT superfamily N-acetyltransferase
MHVAMAMDLTGQVAADALAANQFAGVTGMLDFVRGAMASPGGKSVIMMPSTRRNGKESRIVPLLEETAVVVPRADAHYVVTEYGAANLFGKSLQERALAMIGIAHPDFRDALFHRAQAMGLLSPQHTLSESLHGVYPRKLEETLEVAGETITIRPAVPVDARRIQEHFYRLDREDVVARFFHERTAFLQEEILEVSQVDYVNALTLVALVGDLGFGNVVGVGEYLLETADNMAEVAFSISRKWQKRGLGKVLLRKLADAARENGISGLTAYTNPGNRGMIRLFRTLPYPLQTRIEDDLLTLSCRFVETA